MPRNLCLGTAALSLKVLFVNNIVSYSFFVNLVTHVYMCILIVLLYLYIMPLSVDNKFVPVLDIFGVADCVDIYNMYVYVDFFVLPLYLYINSFEC
jgi:hypothetical protein